jgi:hypothetical protein
MPKNPNFEKAGYRKSDWSKSWGYSGVCKKDYNPEDKECKDCIWSKKCKELEEKCSVLENKE